MTAAGAWRIPLAYRQGMVVPSEHRPRVRLATKAIQRRLIDLGFLQADPALLDGGWGTKTTLAAKAFQHDQGLFVDGIVGRKSARALWFDLYVFYQAAHSIPDNLLYGQGFLESAFDPGAEGDNPHGPGWYDRGLHQINRHAHPEIADDEAYDPPFAISWSAQRLADRFASLGEWKFAVAAHNNPEEAKRWAQGLPPSTPQARDDLLRYVQLVYDAATK